MSMKQLRAITMILSSLTFGLTTGPATADIKSDIKDVEENIEIILVMVAKGQLMASVCANYYPDDQSLNEYQFEFNSATTQPFRTAVSIQSFLDETVPDLTGPKMTSGDPLSHPSVIKATTEVSEALLAVKELGILKQTCASLVNENTVPNFMPSQVDFLFESLLTLDQHFPGIYDFMKKHHYGNK